MIIYNMGSTDETIKRMRGIWLSTGLSFFSIIFSMLSIGIVVLLLNEPLLACIALVISLIAGYFLIETYIEYSKMVKAIKEME